MALHILVNDQNAVGWQLALKYMWTPLTHYFLEYIGWAVYLETHPKHTWTPSVMSDTMGVVIAFVDSCLLPFLQIMD